jgi:hypothetical protein
VTEYLDSAGTDVRSFVTSNLHGGFLLSLRKGSVAGGPRLYDQFLYAVEI